MRTLRYSAVELLVALGLLFVSAPFVEDLPHGNFIEGILLTVVMISEVVAVGGQRKSLIISVLLVTPALAAKWIHHWRPGLLHSSVFLCASVAFFGFVVARLLVFIVKSPRVDANVLCAGVAGFLLLGLVWVPVYSAVASLDPHAFNLPSTPNSGTVLDGFGSFYFSFITLCTVGYGDITPVSNVARMLTVLEAIAGLFYMAMLISRLVSLYSSAPPASVAGNSEGNKSSGNATQTKP